MPLTAYDKAVTLMCCLYRLYGLGGISLGRSIQSQLLDEVLALYPPVDPVTELEHSTIFAVLDTPCASPVVAGDPAPRAEIRSLSDEMLALLLVRSLRDWYRNMISADNREHEFGRMGYAFELEVVEMVCVCLVCDQRTLNYPSADINHDDLIEEARERRHRKYNQQGSLS